MHLQPIVPTNIHSAGYGAVEYGDDSKLFVRFMRKAERMNRASEEAGAPVFEAFDYVEIRQPGEKDALIRRAHDGDVMRFSKQWEAYQAQRDQSQAGQPLEYLFEGKPEIMEMLRARRVHTLESLAGLSEQGIAALGMGARSLVAEAETFLKGMSDAASLKKLQAKVRNSDDEIAHLKQQIKQMGDIIATLKPAKED